ncbi:MAG: hypothetical protein LBD76_07615, partial [Prevotellaceae bacterium]|nr:hypothetical protein [Prevotellaceae bacterium]
MKLFKKLGVLLICWLFASLSAPVFSQTNVDISSPGTLKNVAGIESVTELIITGKIDARDIKFIRDSIPNLDTLDLSGATIVAYTGEGGTYPWGSNSYPADEMPMYSFYNNSTLTSVVLPDGVTSI